MLLNIVRRWFNYILSSLRLRHKQGTILLLGLDNAGKTTLLHRLRTNTLLQYPPTERPSVESFVIEPGGIRFMGWDLGGHEAVRHLWDDYLPQGNAIVFLIDATDGVRLSEAAEELDALIETINCDIMSHPIESPQLNDLESSSYENGGLMPNDTNGEESVSTFPFAILLNKCDLVDKALLMQQIKDIIGFEELALRHGEESINMFRISVLRNEGYQEAFQ
jgi:GTPase SAR1 family protein